VSTVIITGNELTLTIDSKVFAPQVLSVSLEVDDTQEVYETLAGPAYKTVTQPFNLNVTMLADWSTNAGLCASLQGKALGEGTARVGRAPDTGLDFTMVQVGPTHRTTWAGKVFPKVPPAAGAGADVSEITFTLPGDRTTLRVTTAANPS
jgi:hypothetical protein